MAKSKFERGQSTYECRSCGKRTRNTRDEGGVELCLLCYDVCGQENAHYDHDHKLHPDETCCFCMATGLITPDVYTGSTKWLTHVLKHFVKGGA